MKFLWLVLILVVGWVLLRAEIYLFDWLEERDRSKQLRRMFPPDHPFWRM